MLATFRKFLDLLFHITTARKLNDKRGRFWFFKKRIFLVVFLFVCFDFVFNANAALSEHTNPTGTFITPEIYCP